MKIGDTIIAKKDVNLPGVYREERFNVKDILNATRRDNGERIQVIDIGVDGVLYPQDCFEVVSKVNVYVLREYNTYMYNQLVKKYVVESVIPDINFRNTLATLSHQTTSQDVCDKVVFPIVTYIETYGKKGDIIILPDHVICSHVLAKLLLHRGFVPLWYDGKNLLEFTL